MTCAFTTRLRATLTAVGLFVAFGARPGRADDLVPVRPSPMPGTLSPAPAPAPAPTALPALPPGPVLGQPLAGQPVVVPPASSSALPQGSVHGHLTVSPMPGVVVDAPHLGTPAALGAAPVAGGPGCGEKVLSGGEAYLASGCWGPGCTSSMEYLKVDYVHLRRDADDGRTLIAGQILATGDIFTTRIDNDSFGYDPTVRITYGRALVETSACDLFGEVTFFGLHHSNVSDVTFAPAGSGVALFGSPLAPLFTAVTAQRFSYVSDMNSAELNLKWDYYVDNTLYLLLGLRYVKFDDRLTIQEAGELAVVPPPVFVPQAFQRVQVTNNLVGLQIGFDWQSRDLVSAWSFGTYGRAGLYANILDGDLEQGANASLRGPFITELHPGRLQASGVLEAGLVGTYRIAPNMFFRGGYHVMWLGAIALATQQPVPDLFTGDFNGRLSNNQDVLFHGPFVGFEYHWGCCR